jgi:hypothetical protein
MTKIRGIDFLLFAATTTGATKSVIAGSKTVTFDDKKPKIDATTRDGQSFVLGFPEYTLTVDGLVDFSASGATTGLDSKTLLPYYQSGCTIYWQFGLACATPTFPQKICSTSTYLSGCGLITDVKIGSSISGMVDYNASIGGLGAWKLCN